MFNADIGRTREGEEKHSSVFHSHLLGSLSLHAKLYMYCSKHKQSGLIWN